MRGYNAWNYAPYIPVGELTGVSNPYICRLAPNENKIEVEWFHKNYQGKHSVFYSKLDSDQWQEQQIDDRSFVIEDLKKDTEYKLYIKADDGS